jgi:hypothetical protein
MCKVPTKRIIGHHKILKHHYRDWYHHVCFSANNQFRTHLHLAPVAFTSALCGRHQQRLGWSKIVITRHLPPPPLPLPTTPCFTTLTSITPLTLLRHDAAAAAARRSLSAQHGEHGQPPRKVSDRARTHLAPHTLHHPRTLVITVRSQQEQHQETSSSSRVSPLVCHNPLCTRTKIVPFKQAERHDV